MIGSADNRDYQEGQGRETVLVSVAIAVINTMTISEPEKKAYFSLVIASPSSRGVRIATQAGQEPGGRNAEVMGGHCLLVCFLASSACFLTAPKTISPEVALSTVRCPHIQPPSIIHQENAPQANLGGRGGIFSVKIPSSQMTLVYVKLII